MPDDFPFIFELVPPEADDFPADIEILVLEDATDPARIPTPESGVRREPLGSTWAIDRQTRQFAQAPVRITEIQQVLQEKMWLALQVPRGVYPIFTDDFGRDDPYGGVGDIDSVELRVDLQRDVRDTLRQVDERVVSVGSFEFVHDPDSDLMVMNLVATLDDESKIALEGVPLA